MTPSANKLKVAYILKRFPRLSETFILNEILELERRGVEVHIFSFLKPNDGKFHAKVASLKATVRYFDDLDPRKWHDFTAAEWPLLAADSERIWELLRESFERGDSNRINELWWGVWIAAQAKRLGIHHLHSHFGTMSSTVTWFASRVSGVPFSFTVHAKDIYFYDMSTHRLREKLRDAARVVTVTNYNRDYLLEEVPELPADRLRVIYNGIDLAHFKPDATVPREAGLIVSVGRLIPKKGFDDLLDACALLKQRGIPFRCAIVGEGPDEPALLQQRRALDLDAEVEFVGALSQDEVLALMRRADVLALGCKEGPDKNRDALPTVLLEALGAGLPVVSTDFSGIPEIVESGVEGFLVPPGDAKALGEALARVLQDPQLRARLAVAGRAKASERFDVQRNADALVEIYATSAAALARRAAASPAGSGKRIAVLSSDRGISFGSTKGAAVHLREFSEALAAGGYAPVLAVARRDVGSTYRPSYPVHTLPKKGAGGDDEGGDSVREQEAARNRAAQQMLLELHRTGGFEVLYERYSLYGTAGRLAAQTLGVPYVLEVNAPLVEEAAQYRTLEDPALARDVERFLFSTAGHIVTVSAELRDYVHSIAPQAPVSVIPNGVNIERFDRAVQSALWRRKLGALHSDDFVIGFVGRVRPWHGVDLLVDAVAELAAQDRTVRLAVVGAAGDAGSELAARARQRGIPDRVMILDAVAPDAVPYLLKSMDVCVAPYPPLEQFYFSPLKAFEYMAAGRPIVASAIGQLNDVLEHDKTALLVPPGDVAALAQAIGRLRDDTTLAARLGAAAHAAAAQRHSWRHRIADLGRILETLGAGAATR